MRAAYEKELQESAVNEKKIKDGPLDFMVLGLVAAIGILIGNIKIPLGGFGEFSLGAAGGILVSALIFSYIGKIGPINFRMDQKALGILYQTGLTFFMAVVGLRYGYDVVNSLMGSGLQLAIAAVFVENKRAGGGKRDFLAKAAGIPATRCSKSTGSSSAVQSPAAAPPPRVWALPSVPPALRNPPPVTAQHSPLPSWQMFCWQPCSSILYNRENCPLRKEN